MDYMRTVPDKHFNLAIVDPPYMVGFRKMGYWGKKGSSKGVPRGKYELPEWDEQIPGEDYLIELMRVSKHQIIWGINYFRFYHTAGRIVWDKVNGNSPLSDAEIASCSYHDSTRIFRYMWNGMNQAESLMKPEKMQGNKALNEKRIHPTQKPVNLYKWLLDRYAVKRDLILDTHLGSGSSAIAAYQMGFDFTGTEINTKYFNAAEKRFNAFTAQQTIF